MSTRVIVLGGGGHIGSRIVRELNDLDPTSEIVVGDKDTEKARDAAEFVGGRVGVKAVDAAKEDLLVDAIKGFDVVVSSLGPFHEFGVGVLRAAIRAGVNFVDVNDDWDATQEALKLFDEARERGVSAIVGLGATPGITNLLAYHGANKIDEISAIGTYWAWTAVDPTMGPAIVDHYFHAITGTVPTYKDGKWIKVNALSEPEDYRFPDPVGVWEVAHAGHPEPITIPRFIKARNVCNKGTVWPSDLNEVAKTFAELGLTSHKEVMIRDQRIKAREIAVAITLALPDITPFEELAKSIAPLTERMGGEFALSGVGLATAVRGLKEGKELILKYGIACEDATKATALPAAAGALELANNEDAKRGVYPPEAGVVDPDKLLGIIKKQIKIESIETKIEIL
jgi:saccharopine dehydrogenase-like NADP-dependent oxidoreductase